jgi:hypothetical protein
MMGVGGEHAAAMAVFLTNRIHRNGPDNIPSWRNIYMNHWKMSRSSQLMAANEEVTRNYMMKLMQWKNTLTGRYTFK